MNAVTQSAPVPTATVLSEKVPSAATLSVMVRNVMVQILVTLTVEIQHDLAQTAVTRSVTVRILVALTVEIQHDLAQTAATRSVMARSYPDAMVLKVAQSAAHLVVTQSAAELHYVEAAPQIVVVAPYVEEVRLFEVRCVAGAAQKSALVIHYLDPGEPAQRVDVHAWAYRPNLSLLGSRHVLAALYHHLGHRVLLRVGDQVFGRQQFDQEYHHSDPTSRVALAPAGSPHR
jgi:hypothetical protein